jgi:hypothetical protein
VSAKKQIKSCNKRKCAPAGTAAELFEHLIIKKVVFQVNIYYNQDRCTTLLRWKTAAQRQVGMEAQGVGRAAKAAENACQSKRRMSPCASAARRRAAKTCKQQIKEGCYEKRMLDCRSDAFCSDWPRGRAGGFRSSRRGACCY